MKTKISIKCLQLCALSFVLISCGRTEEFYELQSPTPAPESQRVYWSDGDSGRIGDVKFRLADVDAPETGGVGSVGGAKCELERERGYEAKAFMVELTRDAEVTITKSSGEDRYGRLVVSLSVRDSDVAIEGIHAGHLKPWPHDGRKALSPKPDWCG